MTTTTNYPTDAEVEVRHDYGWIRATVEGPAVYHLIPVRMHHTSESRLVAASRVRPAVEYDLDRAETDPCERGTHGCPVRHTSETGCETW
jgi:hypothetical protein